jgi:RNA polymerase sigma factor (TIGR02999 family)
MRDEAKDHTLQTTALVGEAYVRLSSLHGRKWHSRRQFMGVAARAMRRVLVDHARARRAAKRHPEGFRVALDGLVTSIEQRSAGILELDEALTALEATGSSAARAVRVVELRFLCGLTMPEIANALDTSQRTVVRDWEFARAWLACRLR